MDEKTGPGPRLLAFRVAPGLPEWTTENPFSFLQINQNHNSLSAGNPDLWHNYGVWIEGCQARASRRPR